MKKIFFLFIALVFAPNAFVKAQKVWSLKNCIDYAIANNIQVKQQQLGEQIAKISLTQSKLSLVPNLNGDASHAYNNGKTIDMYTNQFATSTVQSDNFYLSSSVTLFNGFQLLNTVKQNKINLQASEFDLEKMTNDISLNLSTAYLQILYNIELLKIANNQLAITNQQVKRTHELFDAGTVAKGTLLTIEAQSATDELNVVNAKNNLDLSYLTLTQMLDITSTDSFAIEVPKLDMAIESTILATPDQIYSIASGKQPEIKSAELKVQSNEIGLAIARGMRSPNLSLRLNYGTGFSGASKKVNGYQSNGMDTIGYTSGLSPLYVLAPNISPKYGDIPFKQQLNDNVNKSISLNLTIPIFNNWQVNANISKAKIAIENANLSLQLAQNTLLKSIQQAYADALASQNKYKASKKSVDALTEAYKYAEQKFDVGLLNTTEYNDAKNKLAEAESNRLQAKFEYVFRLKILDFYMGKPIELK